jgi:hypothetical protein
LTNDDTNGRIEVRITQPNKVVSNVTASENKEIIIMQNDKAIENSPEVCNKLLDMVGKPDNFHMCKALNVYDDRYRVNVFVKEEVEDITGHKLYIDKSYFCRYNGSDLTIVS